jgi:hypothetical protein
VIEMVLKLEEAVFIWFWRENRPQRSANGSLYIIIVALDFLVL